MSESLDTIIKRKFARYSDQQLIDRANRAADFQWDDEAYEIERGQLRVKRERGGWGKLVLVRDYHVTVNHVDKGIHEGSSVDDVLEPFRQQYPRACFGVRVDGQLVHRTLD